MSVLDQLVILSSSTIRTAMELININAAQICFIVDSEKKLMGALSDGDIRRALLSGASLDSPVTQYMNKTPRYVKLNLDQAEIIQKMKQWEVKQLPVVDDNNRLTHVEIFDELIGLIKKNNRVVLMAGGMGLRLRPLTESTPKPLLPIAGVPILERIIARFRDVGFYKFTICVNYLGYQIKDYFGDGSKFNVEIDYIVETKEMGTCGSLSLLKNKIVEPVVVMNGDILTLANFGDLVKFHNDKSAIATMCVKEYVVDIPYGTVQLSEHKIEKIVEKPKEVFHINAGIYVLSKEALAHIPDNTSFDMPSLFSKLNEADKVTNAYILKDYWLDIGRIEDYHKAQFIYEESIQKKSSE